ncbi:MAG: iron-containing alcohol dehydrogenase [Kiritimatiellia bacterium]
MACDAPSCDAHHAPSKGFACYAHHAPRKGFACEAPTTSAPRSPPHAPEIPLASLPRDHTVLWADPARVAAIPELAALPAVHDLAAIPAGTLTLVVAGGGDRIDRAKVFRARQAPHLRLIAVPTLWGSGAEASRVAVLNTPAGKEIHVGDELLPDAIAFPDALIASTPESLRRAGIGDAFSHVFEAFISPLATDEIRAAAAALLRDLLALDDCASPVWFRHSAHACALQAASGVGLIHGIAHTPNPLGVRGPLAPGHAGLCSLFLLPVLDFDLAHSENPPPCSPPPASTPKPSAPASAPSSIPPPTPPPSLPANPLARCTHRPAFEGERGARAAGSVWVFCGICKGWGLAI